MENEKGDWRDDPKMEVFMQEVQFQNSIGAIEEYEYSKGGLSPIAVWELADVIRQCLIDIPAEERPTAVPTMLSVILYSMKDKPEISSNPARSVICIGVMLGLRLVLANADREKNPHKEIILNTLSYLKSLCKDDKELLDTLSNVMERINKDGDINEAKGNKIPIGLDVLAKPEVKPDGPEVRQEPSASEQQAAQNGRSRMRR